MSFFDWFRGRKAKAADPRPTDSETMTLNQLVQFLGLQNTEGKALSEATYYACIKVLSESIGKLPLKLLQSTPESGVRPVREHRYYRMLNERPNRFMSASVFWSYIEMCRNHYGNAYALIDESNPKRPQLWPLDPNSMQVWYDDAKMVRDVPDVYYVYSYGGGVLTFGSEEILHFKSNHTRDGLVGIPVREQLASTIQGNIKAQQLVNKMYDSGMTAKVVLQYTGSLKDTNVELLTKGIEAYAKGEMKNKGIENVIPIPLGMQLTPLNIKLADNQFLEVKQYSALQIASAFGVRPYQIGDYTKSSYSSAEAQQLSFLVETLLYIVKQYEEELSWKLLTDQEEAAGLHAKFNTAVILRADQQTQINTLSTAVSNFLMCPNEARERLDLPHKPGGDRLIGNGSTVPITALGIQWGQNAAEVEAQFTQQAPPVENTTAREEEKAWLKKTIFEIMKELQE